MNSELGRTERLEHMIYIRDVLGSILTDNSFPRLGQMLGSYLELDRFPFLILFSSLFILKLPLDITGL
jgi:hypothetical protein